MQMPARQLAFGVGQAYKCTMNRFQKIALLVAAVNLSVIFLFPPFDSHSLGNTLVPIFAGFHPVFTRAPSETVNSSLLFLETAVVLINAGIAWLLLQPDKSGPKRHKFNYQKTVLAVVAVNLVVILLFPPLQHYQQVTLAILPSFQGFYFIFSPHQNMTVVSAMLYIEVIFVLVNGGIFWLLFKESPESDAFSLENAAKLMRELKKRS